MKKRTLQTAAGFALLALSFAASGAQAADGEQRKRVLFFSKAASWEQKIVHRDPGEELSYIETAVRELGPENGVEFTFSKDGTIFTAANLAKFDALFFYTSGDLTAQPRNGRGDNFPLMTLEGKRAFLDAIEHGLGFVGCNTANYTFPERLSPGEAGDQTASWRYTGMIGAGYLGHNEVQRGVFTHVDRRFPGMEAVPRDYQPVDQWYAFNRLAPDLHVIMALDARRLAGNLYERESYPVAWARMQGRGRVFYTTMGHTAEIWRDPVFLRMLGGGIRWATRQVEADVTPDLATVTPHAAEIPERASKFISEHPPVVDPHFPGFKVWLEQPCPLHGRKRVLVYTKSAGPEHPLVYRDTAWPSPLEQQLLAFGDEHAIDFIFTKDGAQFTPANLATFDSVLLFTSGDPCVQDRNGAGDNYPLMPAEGLEALSDAVRAGKGLLAFHTSLECGATSLLGSGKPAVGSVGRRRLRIADPESPAVAGVVLSADFAPPEESFTLDGLREDVHVVLTTDAGKSVAWTRVEGEGRVYVSTLGHAEETWRDASFRAMLLAAIRWTTREDAAADGGANRASAVTR